MSTALLLAAHGSVDPRAVATVDEIVHAVRRRLPCIRVEVGYLDHVEPHVGEALDGLVDAGPVVVAPLLFAPGYHSEVDLPAVLTSTRERHPGADVRLAAPLGPHAALAGALTTRLGDAGLRSSSAATIVLVGAGDVGPMVPLLEAATGAAVVASSVDTLAAAIGTARTKSGLVAVAPLLLAPGWFADRITTEALGADVVAAPLGAHPSVVGLVVDRYVAAMRAAAA